MSKEENRNNIENKEPNIPKYTLDHEGFAYTRKRKGVKATMFYCKHYRPKINCNAIVACRFSPPRMSYAST